MKIDLHSELGHRERLMIELSEFSYAAFPVHINHVFRFFPDTKSSQIKRHKLALSRMFQTLVGAVRQSARSAGFQIGTNRLQIFENGCLASAWTARAFAARMFIGFKHPESSWVTGHLPVALWPETFKREIQQAGFAKSAVLEVCTN